MSLMATVLMLFVWVVSAFGATPEIPKKSSVVSAYGKYAPVISGVPVKVILVGSSYSFIPEASDPDSESSSLTFNIINCPSWAVFDPKTGILSGKPSVSDIGTYKNIIISAKDASLTNSIDSFTIEVVTSAIYVSNTGNDTNDGRTLDKPLKTIQKAADIVLPGDTIFVRRGTHAGGIIRRAGLSAGWITLKPYPDEKVIVDASLNDIKYLDNAIYFYNKSCDPYDITYTVPCQAAYWIIEGLEIRGGNLYVVKIDQRFVQLRNNNMYGSKNDIVKVVKTADDVTITNNQIHDNNAVNGFNAQAVDIVGADRVYVGHNHIYNIPSVGMFAKGNARNAVFENNFMENIYDRGIMLGQSTDTKSLVDGPYECYDCIARNNIIKNAGYGCFGVSGASNAMIYNNTCYMAAATGQAAIYLSRESEIATRSCGVDIRNNIIHVASASSRAAIKVGYQGMHNGVATALDPAERCPGGFNTLTIDNNIYWNESNNPSSATFLWEDIGIYSPTSFANWKVKTGKDGNSRIADPQFVDVTKGNYDVKTSSPSIDSGVSLPNVTLDYNMNPRPKGLSTDIGAFEH